MADHVISQSYKHRLGSAGVRKDTPNSEFRFNRIVPSSHFPFEQCRQKYQETDEFNKRNCKKQVKHFPSAGPRVPLEVFRYNRVQSRDRIDCRKPGEYNHLDWERNSSATKQLCNHLLPPAGISTDEIGDVFRFSMVQPRHHSATRRNFENRMWNHSDKVFSAREELAQFNNRFPVPDYSQPQTRTRPTPRDCCSGCRCCK